jgi:hypothetical protein
MSRFTPEIGETATIIVDNGRYWHATNEYIPKLERLSVLVISIGPKKSVVVDNENDDNNTIFSVNTEDLMSWEEAKYSINHK